MWALTPCMDTGPPHPDALPTAVCPRIPCTGSGLVHGCRPAVEANSPSRFRLVRDESSSIALIRLVQARALAFITHNGPSRFRLRVSESIQARAYQGTSADTLQPPWRVKRD